MPQLPELEERVGAAPFLGAFDPVEGGQDDRGAEKDKGIADTGQDAGHQPAADGEVLDR